MSYCFINPLDLTLMSYPTLDAALIKAKSFLGTEDAYGETVTELDIFAMQQAGTVTMEFLKHSSPDGEPAAKD